jgi:threonylcarbamoyladenosine tRNA methylthiotransferase MtaB
MSKTVSIVTLGCKTNQFESAAMGEQLKHAGYRQVDFESGAELVVVNTCTVTAATDSQSRNLIRRAKRFNPQARVVVTGCYAQIDPESLNRLPGVSLVIGNQEKAQLLDHLTENVDSGHIQVSDIHQAETIEPLSLTGFEQRSRAFVQIQNGCDAFCSYCIIPYARGRSRSVPLQDVVAQVEKLSANAYPEIVLTGIHIGNYGRDLKPQTDLLDLLKRIEQSGFSGRLRLGSIEPTELTADLYRYVAESDWICPHFHIPLQAGDNEILRLMNRHYSTEFFAKLLESIHQLQPDAAIGLDVITGFPGETDVHFDRTRQLLEQLPFSHLHVFPFSKRAATPAAKMLGQVSGTVKKERAAHLRRLGEMKNEQFRQRFIGTQQSIVLEGGVTNGRRKGMTGNYLPVWIEDTALSRSELLTVSITKLYQDGFAGTLV